MSSDQPTTTGTFGKTPLLHVLVSLLERASTGTLVIETPAAVRSALYLERGVPTKMRLGTNQVRLGEHLIELGYLQRDLAASTYATAVEKHQLHGKTLVEAGLLTEDNLQAALRSQLVQKLMLSAALPTDTVFGFYENADYLSKWRAGATPVAPLVAAWALTRSQAAPNVVATVLHHIEGYPLRLHPQAEIRSFGFERAEQALLDVLKARPQTLESLNQLGISSPHTLERVIYVLTLTRHLDFGRNLSPLGIGAVTERDERLLERKETLHPSRPVFLGAVTETSPLPPNLTPLSTDATPAYQAASAAVTQTVKRVPVKTDPAFALSERLAQLEKLARNIDTMDHFEVLGISKNGSVSGVQETYLKLAKIFHPDRLPQELADLKPLATKVFARISEAHQILSEPTKRQAYLDSLTRNGNEDSEEEKVRRILRAAGSYQKAEVLLKKRMLAAAELEANRALEDDPGQPDYLALYAWIQSNKTDSEPRLPELLRMLNDAMLRNPASEKNRYYRVQILKRLGRTDEAVADCRLIVDKNPHHVDASREVRLWEMRRPPQKSAPGAKSAPGTKPVTSKQQSKPPSSPPSTRKQPESHGGLLGRLFKR